MKTFSLALFLFSTLMLGQAAPSPTTAAPASKSNSVLLKTSLGDIVVELDPVHAPISTANFLSYVEAKAYDGTIFHRVIPGFCAQGGGFKPNDLDSEISRGKAPIKNESSNGLHNLRGTIAMARTNDPNSATSQFYFNLADNASLDTPPGYAVFGKITQGLDVLDKMAQVPTTNVGPMSDVPTNPILILSATRVP